jgi:hypothetical protein
MLLIYTQFKGNRLKYVFDYIFQERFGIIYNTTDDLEYYAAEASMAKLSYGIENPHNGLFVFASSSLWNETNTKQILLNEAIGNNLPLLFSHQNKNSALSFDIFASVFYLLTRYEEYVYEGKDEYGNFDYRQSVLYKLNILDKPIIEEWLDILKSGLQKNFPTLNFKQERPRYILSFDIDVAYEYRNRTAFRTFSGVAKKIATFNVNAFQDQLLTLLNKKKDSFDTYQYIEDKIKNIKALFFFNMGKYGKYDKNPSYKNETFRKLICSLHKKHFAGLHPSYASNYQAQLLLKEKQKLEEITKQEVTFSRQHYLKIKMPDTFQKLLQNGIKKDFSIGYYLYYGFRAGTCHSFLFFDLSTNEITKLRLYPFAFMDGTLSEVLHMTPEKAKLCITELIEAVKRFNGVFIPLWHNSALSESGIWKGWRNVFEHMLKELEEKDFECVTNIEAE